MKSMQKTIFTTGGKGFTLVELMISLGIFSAALAIAAVIFSRGIAQQRTLSELVSISTRASATFEQMAREIRTGADFCGTLGAPCGADALSFINAKGENVSYTFEEHMLWRSADGEPRPLLGEDERVNAVRFVFRGIDRADALQPLITVFLSAGSRKPELQGIEARFQTTISPRILEQ